MIVHLVLLYLLFLLMILVEQKHWNLGSFSPMMCFGAPTLAAIFIAVTIGPSLGFISFNSEAVDIWIYGFISFWLGGMLVVTFAPGRMRTVRIPDFSLSHIRPRFMNVTCMVMLFIAILGLRQTLADSGNDLEKGDYGTHGIVGHVNGFIVGYCIFYILSLKKKMGIKRLLAIAFILIIMMLKIVTGIRGNIVIPLLGGIIALGVAKQIKFSLKALIISGSVILIFFIGTTFFFNDKYNVDSGELLFSYVFFYMVSGVFGLNSVLENKMVVIGQNPEYIITFFKNLFIAILGNENEKYAQLLLPDFALCTTSEALYPFASNVYTLVGNIYVNVGYGLGCVFFIILGAYTYFLYLNIRKGVFILIAYSFVAANLAMGLFSEYVLYTYFYTVQGFLFLLHFMSKINYKSNEISRCCNSI